MKAGTKILLGCVLALIGLQANALTLQLKLSPVDCGTTYGCWTSNDTNPIIKNPDVGDFSTITGSISLLDEYYKMNVGGSEEGSFQGHYTTIFSNTPSDPADATISWDGGSAIKCPECYLKIKGGAAHDPIWYLFDIGSWDGRMDIMLSGFWPNNGAISHVAIWGLEGQVPEPGPLGLLAAGVLLIGLRQLKKNSR